MTEAFGRAVRELRSERGMSQEALSFAAGRHDTYIRRVEQGRSSPTLDTIVALAKALGVTPSTLVRRAEAISGGS